MRDWGSSPSDVCITSYTSLPSRRYEQVLRSRSGGLRGNIFQLRRIRRIFAYKRAARCTCITQSVVNPGNRHPRVTASAALGTIHLTENSLPLTAHPLQVALGQDPWWMYELMPCLFDTIEKCRQPVVKSFCVCDCTQSSIFRLPHNMRNNGTAPAEKSKIVSKWGKRLRKWTPMFLRLHAGC